LRTKIFADADEFFSQPAESQKVINFAPQAETANRSSVNENRSNIVEVESQRPFWQWLGWAFAAAACVALAINLWLTRFQKPTEIVKNSETIQTPTPELTAAQKTRSTAGFGNRRRAASADRPEKRKGNFRRSSLEQLAAKRFC
jgi:anti-sigma-K factor RskA